MWSAFLTLDGVGFLLYLTYKSLVTTINPRIIKTRNAQPRRVEGRKLAPKIEAAARFDFITI